MIVGDGGRFAVVAAETPGVRKTGEESHAGRSACLHVDRDGARLDEVSSAVEW